MTKNIGSIPQKRFRFGGFTGHKDPSIHLDMLNRDFQFDTVQMPVNPLDPSYRSFEREVLPVALQKRISVVSMKSMGRSGEAIVRGALTPTEALSYAMSVSGISTTISGIDSMAVWNRTLRSCDTSNPIQGPRWNACGNTVAGSTIAATSYSRVQ